jgi:hypothetical protein
MVNANILSAINMLAAEYVLLRTEKEPHFDARTDPLLKNLFERLQPQKGNEPCPKKKPA